LTTRIVPMDAIYDQFSYGEEDPAALKAFLAYASSNWTKAPRYVLFGGDASLDPRDSSAEGRRCRCGPEPDGGHACGRGLQ